MKSINNEPIEIYTDGACDEKSRIGGWACIVIEGDYVDIINGCEVDTTHNRMELIAVIEGLKYCKGKKNIIIHSDSSLVVDSINKGRIDKWIKNNWKTKSGKDRRNKDLWLSILDFKQDYIISWDKVKAHSKIYYNNLANKYARKAMKDKIKS
jgi:ribonuclease HI